MSKVKSIKSNKVTEFQCVDLRGISDEYNSIDSRHQGIPGYDQDDYSGSEADIIGDGGLNCETAEGAVRKGIGRLNNFDHDDVELTNLNRQLFTKEDIGKNKAICLSKNLSKMGFMGTKIRAYPYFFQQALEMGIKTNPDIIICGVDNDQTRIFVSKYGLKHNIPVIFSAVSGDGNNGYVFVQESGGPCFGCAFPSAISNIKTPCPGVPAIKDILKVVSGFTLYAMDSILMERRRNWNLRLIFLSGDIPDGKNMLKRKDSCRLCSKK